ncbi:hypothetical protein B0T18DRAFT_401974 [Schizothecium vesticola]|uniref:Uncharacterized protein n=1 Tax=Schizothecium vesticola TaxID=314040 RepID=A0AA40F4N1_9PEZI|nr:hypothetical protein B0T18DRAFT_401974 [Schizothecium vesticola]
MDGATLDAASAPPFPLSNASVWHNLTTWLNMTRLAPSLEDLFLAGPRIIWKLGRLGSFDGLGQRVIPESTGGSETIFHVTTAAGETSTLIQSVLAPTVTDAANRDPAAFARFSMEGARGLGSIFSYVTSKWALSCIIMAVIFNRAQIFAATRRRLRLRWQVRLALRLPILLVLLSQARGLLQSIQCQTSPDFADMRWGNASKSSDLMFSHSDTLLHGVSSVLLFGASDRASCEAIKMVPWDNREQPELVGSLSRLWPLFATFCFSQFVEVVSATVQGRPTCFETGMTLFEHSLAFAEADAAISNQLGWGLFTNGSNASSSTLGTTIAVTRSMIMKRVNTPPEVLLVGFLSAMGHVTSHVLGVFNAQPRFRLISTGFWGLCFMAGLVHSAVTFSLDDSSSQGFLRYPTVCIISNIPHILVLGGIVACAFIYAVALVLSALAGPETGPDGHRLSITQRLALAHGNMQANVSLSDIRIRLDMDFYTALLRAGFGAITMASEAVYLNEDHHVNLKRDTWLEDDRFREVEELRMQWLSGGVTGSRFDSVGAIGLVPIKDGQAHAASGFARERAAQNIPKNNASARRARDGVGAAERSGRWLMAFEYIMYINRLLLTTWALITLRFLSFLGIRNPPRWIRWLSLRPKGEEPKDQSSSRTSRSSRPDWVTTSVEDEISPFNIPRSSRVDTEAEFRRRIPQEDSELDSKLYRWWLIGGWWGNTDTSGDYTPASSPEDLDDPDFDTTSVISATETDLSTDDQWPPSPGSGSGSGWVSDPNDSDLDLDDGQRTPTQSHPASFASQLQSARAARHREQTPLLDTPIAAADLARLLHPQSPEDRDEARTLAAHLASDRILTRSRFRQHETRQRARVLLTSATAAGGRPAPNTMSPDEEAQRLEQLLLSRRRSQRADITTATAPSYGDGEAAPGGTTESWATGAAGLGPDGPQCVVCQSAPRTIIVWPCRCLSLCDECRVSLALNNFEKCVCCRREVVSFSRIYVP